MGQTVYVDLFFLINFSMDFLCFFLTSKILASPPRFGRMVLAAAVGGCYAGVALFLPLGGGTSMAADLLACGAICLLAYGKRGQWRSMPMYILVYTAVSMTLGGFMTALFNLLNRSGWFGAPQSVEKDGISVWLFAALAGISALVTLLGGRMFTKRTGRGSAEVTFFLDGKSICLPAMADTGNLLRDPLGGRLCIVADIGSMRGFLPEEILSAAGKGAVSSLGTLSGRHAGRVRLIPVRTASGEGMLLGLRMERITVRVERSEREVDATVALADLGQSAGGNRILLPSELMAV